MRIPTFLFLAALLALPLRAEEVAGVPDDLLEAGFRHAMTVARDDYPSHTSTKRPRALKFYLATTVDEAFPTVLSAEFLRRFAGQEVAVAPVPAPPTTAARPDAPLPVVLRLYATSGYEAPDRVDPAHPLVSGQMCHLDITAPGRPEDQDHPAFSLRAGRWTEMRSDLLKLFE